MKKFKFFTILIIILSSILISGCASAYDVAVKNGYSGTEQQWLESLKGKDGSDGSNLTIEQVYSYAQKNGFEGTYLDFLDRYLKFDVGQSNEAAISKGLRSSVEIYAAFDKASYLGQSSYMQGGSGIIYKLNKSAGTAYIITNYHVVYSEKSNSGKISSNITVVPYEGQQIPATYIGGTPLYDIAVLKIDGFNASDFVTAVTANTQNVTVGQTAIAIGNPSGGGLSATQGIVSVDSEVITLSAIDNPGSQVDMRVIRIDAAVNSGNSGGGLFNDSGELIGVVNAKSGDNEIENVGYAIPASVAVSVAENILRNGVFNRGLAGITVRSENIRAYLDENGRSHIAETVVIESVNGAASGILQKDDVIISVAVFGKEVTVERSFNVVDVLLAASPDDEVTFVVERKGEKMSLTVKLKS